MFIPSMMGFSEEKDPYNSLQLNNDPYTQIENYKKRLQNVDIEAPERKENGLKNMLVKTLDVLDRPGNAIRSGIYDVMTDTGSFTKGLTEGFTGKQHHYGSDILDAAGVDSKLGKTIGGFALDVLLDPTTYLTGGTAKTFTEVAGRGVGMIGGSAARNAIDKAVVKTGLMSAGTTVSDFGKKFAQTFEQNIPGLTQSFTEKGMSAFDPDTFNSLRDITTRQDVQLRKELKSLDKGVSGISGHYLPGLGDKVNAMDYEHTRDFVNDVYGAAIPRVQQMSGQQRIGLVNEIFTDLHELPDASDVLTKLSDFSDGELRMASVMRRNFDVGGKDALSIGQQVHSKLLRDDYTVREGLYKLVDKKNAQVIQRQAIDGNETAIRMLNGMEDVFNHSMGATYLKFMGHPFLNVTDTFGKWSSQGVRALASSSVVQGTRLGTGLWRMNDAIGTLFRNEHISKLAYGRTETRTVDTAGSNKYLYDLMADSKKGVDNGFNAEAGTYDQYRSMNPYENVVRIYDDKGLPTPSTFTYQHEMWNLEEVRNGNRPAFMVDESGMPEVLVRQFASDNGLACGYHVGDDMLPHLVVAKDEKALREVLDATDERSLNLALGHMDVSHVVNTPRYQSKVFNVGGEVYQGGKTVARETTKYVRKETALPHHSTDTALNLFKDIAPNMKLRRATAIAIEGMGDDADHWAAAKWAEEAAKLAPEELVMVEKAVMLNKFFMQALSDEDMSELMKRVERMQAEGKDPARFVENIEYKARENYLHHVYQPQFGSSINQSVTPKTAKELASMQVNPQQAFMKARTYKSLAMAEAHGEKPVYDVIASFAMRLYEGERSKLANEFSQHLDYMIKNPEQFPGVEHVLSAKQKKGMVQLPGAFEKFYGTIEVRQQMMRLAEEPQTNAGWAYFVQVFDKATNLVKTLQTSASPAFLLRNMVGETLMNFMANVKPEAHDIAAKIMMDEKNNPITRVGNSYFYNGKPLIRLTTTSDGKELIQYGRAYRNPNWSPELHQSVVGNIDEWGWSATPDVGKKLAPGHMSQKDTVIRTPFKDQLREAFDGLGLSKYELNGKTYSSFEIMEMFRNNGLGWSGITKGNLVENITDLARSEVRKNRLNPIQYMKDFGDATETWTRLAHMVDRMDRGWGVERATQDVRKFHVDYRDLTSTEQNLFRRIAPYYTYMRKNTPIQVRQMMLNPGKYMMISHLINEGYNTLKYDPNYAEYGAEPTTPDYLKESLALPVDIDNNGNVRYINWNLPVADIARLQLTGAGFLQTNVVDMLHPLIKGTIELYQDKTLGRDAQIYKYPGESAPLMSGWQESGTPRIPKWSDYMLSQLGVIQSARQAAGQVMSNVRGEPEDPGKPDQIPMLKSLLPLVNSQQAANSNAYQYRDELQDYVRYIGNEVGEEVPQLPRTRGITPMRKMDSLPTYPLIVLPHRTALTPR